MSATYDQLQEALGAALAEVDGLRRQVSRLRGELEQAKADRREARSNAKRAFGETVKMLAERAGVPLSDDPWPCNQIGDVVRALMARAETAERALAQAEAEKRRLPEALKVVRRWIYEGSPEAGWNLDRLDAALAAGEEGSK
jgi:chromosome segregation ATPase